MNNRRNILLLYLLYLYSLLIYEARNDSVVPMWSKGFAFHCCDVFPSTIGLRDRSFFERGMKNDPTYFYVNRIKSGDVIYVVTSDLSDFVLSYFSQLPSTTRIILVTGCEDIGAPYEIFHPNRPNFFDYNIKALWPKGQQEQYKMEKFLSDDRLVAWFVQNYDAVGCNLYTCSPLQPSSPLVQKIFPIPIGLDLHSFGNHQANDINSFVSSAQYQDMAALNLFRQAVSNRLVHSIVVSFECKFDHTRIGQGRMKSRGDVCKLLQDQANSKIWNIVDYIHISSETQITEVTIGNRLLTLTKGTIDSWLKKSNIDTTTATYVRLHQILTAMSQSTKEPSSWSPKELRRLNFWMLLSISKYSLAPAGFGMDTHRLWEILQFGCIPITVTSPLDILYREFPIIILQKWEDLYKDKVTERFEEDMRQRFGSSQQPFNETTRTKLTLNYWIDVVRQHKIS